jgi:hypothetical protein
MSGRQSMKHPTAVHAIAHNIDYVSLGGSSPAGWLDDLQQELGIRLARLTPAQVVRVKFPEGCQLLIVESSSLSHEFIEFCSGIRPLFQNPLLALVPPTTEDLLISLYAAGVDECVVGPVEVELMAAKVRSWLRWATHNGVDSQARPSPLFPETSEARTKPQPKYML